MAPATRERRTVEVVKSIVTKLRERILASGPLSAEEETALSQLEQLYVTKFVQSVRENRSGSTKGYHIDTNSISFDGKRADSDQSLSSFSTWRRDSDASISNDAHLPSSTSLKTRFSKQKDRDYCGKDLWRRQWQRRKRLELRKLVKPLPLRVDETKGVSAVYAAVSLYEELLQQSKAPLSAYDILITTLRSYYSRETWPDLVEAYVGQFIQNHILLSAEEIRQKHSIESASYPVVVEQLNECKLQALLRLHTLPPTIDDGDDDSLDETLEVLRMVSLISGESNALQKFLDDDVLESFLDSAPQTLVRLFEALGVSLPSELNPFASNEKAKKSSEATTCSLKNKSSNLTFSEATTPKIPSRRPTEKRGVKTKFTDDKSGCVRKRAVNERSVANKEKVVFELKPKKAKMDRHMEDDKAGTTSKSKIVETITSDEKPSTECRMSKVELATGAPISKIIGKTSTSAVLVSVRQSPRHHASTRALHSSTSNTLSLLLQKEHLGGSTRNGFMDMPLATTSELLNESTRLILVKAKRGYFLKKFIRDGNGEQRLKDAPSKTTASDKMTKPAERMTNYNVRNRGGGVEKLTMEKRKPATKKTCAVLEHKKRSGKKAFHQKKTLKNPGRVSSKEEEAVAKSNYAGESSHSFVLKACGIGSSRISANVTIHRRALNGHQNPQSNLDSKSSKSQSVKLDKCQNGTSKSTKSKLVAHNAGGESSYALPSYAVENYVKYVNGIRRERKLARHDDQAELFYARGTRRYSIFYDGMGRDDPGARSPVSKCYSDEHMAPKNRTGRKMKSSVEVFHLANYLLNIRNENPSAPAVPKNLQQTLNTPIRLYKKLRLASKNNRRRSLRQFCALKFNADEFKLSVDSGTSNASTADEERSATETDECASLELNCGELQLISPNEESQQRHPKTELTVDTKFSDDSVRRNSVSVCAGLAKLPTNAWNFGGEGVSGCDSCTQPNGYYLRRRRLFSDGHVSSVGSSLLSPDCSGMKGTMLRRRDGGTAAMQFKEAKERLLSSGSGPLSYSGTSNERTMTSTENQLFLATESPCRDQFLDQHAQAGTSSAEERGSGIFLDHLSSQASGLLQFAKSPLICAGLTSKNYSQVTTDVR